MKYFREIFLNFIVFGTLIYSVIKGMTSIAIFAFITIIVSLISGHIKDQMK